MTNHVTPKHTAAWYYGTREEFLATPKDAIANQLAGRAASESLEIESAQSEEWRRSVELLQRHLDERLPILRQALLAPGCEAIRDVILEFDFRRRGLRMDCLLLSYIIVGTPSLNTSAAGDGIADGVGVSVGNVVNTPTSCDAATVP